MRLSDDALGRHAYVLGGTGVGKSRALESWFMQFAQRNQGVAFIDVHGESYANLVTRLAERGRHSAGRVVLLDPLHDSHVIGLNPLEPQAGQPPERRAQFLASVVTKIFQADPLITARMQRMMFHAFLLLMLARLTLVEFVPLLVEPLFRAQLLDKLADKRDLRRYWEKEFPKDARTATEWTQSSLNKVGELVSDPDLALMFGQVKSTINFRQIMDEQNILLVNLPKGILGEKNSHLAGAFILAQLQLAALSRAEASPMRRFPRFTLFVDEFQNYLTDDVQVILAETRKYNLSLIMAHQYFAQLAEHPSLQEAIINTVGNLVAFRIGATDAEHFMKSFFSPPLDAAKEIRTRKQPTGIRWFPYTTEREVVWRPLDEIWELEARKLTELPDRWFWYKQKGAHEAQLLHSLDMPNVRPSRRLDEAKHVLIEAAMTKYGRAKDDVRAEIEARMHPRTHPALEATHSFHAEDVAENSEDLPIQPPASRPRKRSGRRTEEDEE